MPSQGFSICGAAIQVIALWGIRGEVADAFETIQREVRESPALRPMPLTVLSAGLQAEFWHEMQRELATQLPDARHVIADGSGHTIQQQQPQLVSAAVRDIVMQLRGQ